MTPRGVTLVELLVAISIILVVSALSLPAIQGRLGEARVESARELVESACIAARAEAVRSGRVVELLAGSGRGGFELQIREVQQFGAGEGRESVASSHDREGSRERSNSPAPPAKRLWGVLPAGVRVEPALSVRDDSSTPLTPDEIPVALFLPDGMARASGRSILTDGEWRLGISINGWSGRASFEPVVDDDALEDDLPGGVR